MATVTGATAIPSTIDSTILSTSLADYQKRLVDNVYNDVVMFKLANESGMKKTINGGISIVETLIESKQDDGGFYLGADVLNNTQGHDTTLVEFKWQNCYEPIQITRDEERSNAGDMHKIIIVVILKFY